MNFHTLRTCDVLPIRVDVRPKLLDQHPDDALPAPGHGVVDGRVRLARRAGILSPELRGAEERGDGGLGGDGARRGLVVVADGATHALGPAAGPSPSSSSSSSSDSSSSSSYYYSS